MSDYPEENANNKPTQKAQCPTCGSPGFKVLPPEEMPRGETNTPNSMLVECTECGQKSRLTWHTPIRLNINGKAPETPVLTQPKRGDTLRLDDSIGNLETAAFIAKGLFVVTKVEEGGEGTVTLSRLGTNEDGELCTTAQTVQITREQFPLFRVVRLNLPPLETETNQEAG